MITRPKTEVSRSPFLTIPLEEIDNFLSYYGLAIPYDLEETYLVAWNYLLDHPGTYVPSVLIADFLLAYQHQDEISQKYTTSFIILAPEEELVSLADSLGLPSVNKERIIRMLGYLDLLDNDASFFDKLPEEVLWFLGSKLDCKSLGLLCQISTKFNKSFCGSNQLVELFRSKLQETTGLDLTHYTKEQLGFLCRAGDKNHCLTGGNEFSLVCNSQGQVFSFGANDHGQLGLGDLDGRTTPTLIEQFEGVNEIPFIVSVSASGARSLLLDSQGQVWSFGEGYLGLGDYHQRPVPTRLEIPKMTAISVGGEHSLLLDSQGQIWIFGSNAYHQLGTGDQELFLPELLKMINIEIIAISAGGLHSLVLTRAGQVLSFGDNSDGQLGLNDFKRRFSPEAPEIVDDSLTQCLIVAISAGYLHSLVLDDQGRVFSFGENEHGQLGLGEDYSEEDAVTTPTMIEKISNIVAILAGTTHSLLLDSRGQVWSFGQNGFGELGLGTYFPVSYPVMSLVISEVVAIYAGNEHSLFVDVQGQVFGCGQYKQGQLGIKMRPGFFNLITKPTVIGGLIV